MLYFHLVFFVIYIFILHSKGYLNYTCKCSMSGLKFLVGMKVLSHILKYIILFEPFRQTKIRLLMPGSTNQKCFMFNIARIMSVCKGSNFEKSRIYRRYSIDMHLEPRDLRSLVWCRPSEKYVPTSKQNYRLWSEMVDGWFNSLFTVWVH